MQIREHKEIIPLFKAFSFVFLLEVADVKLK